ncbi:conserved hypothetical protein [Xenorhabdus bovienii str. kraussei Quebec]|uniref:Inclusion body protein n=1 Tax=Xenorhabdus bovienii str. kraussei Quebec TaxID=1398203 RepID=A0A077PNS7_XENBV|nr:AidA/PixA family protein [Xenorhabdus bovienii]CDH22132.1 conserved hypothetical protein [Xenorhabdus bovienii str. kraussei Quebec]
MNIIDILVTVDAQSIREKYRLNQDPTNPLPINPDPYIHMLTNNQYVNTGQGGYELNIFAKKGDEIRWHVVTISKDAQYTANLEEFILSSSNPDDINKAKEYLSTPSPLLIASYVPVLLSSNPVKMGTMKAPGYYWTTNVTKSPEPNTTYEIAYRFNAGIYFDDILQGYVTWDPFVTITNS